MAQTIDSSYLIENWENHFKVYAGPGAGKTYFIIRNIKNLIEKNPKLLKCKEKKILCITYTNVAVDEIKQRLNEHIKYVEVSTIHKFIADNIISPFQKQLKKLMKDEFEIQVPQNIKIASQVEGLGVLHGFKKEEIYSFVEEKEDVIGGIDYSISAISDIQVNIEKFVGENVVEIQDDKYHKINPAHKKYIKEFIWTKAGKLTHDEILYFGYKLIKEYPLISHILRVNYPFILVDEFQDTSPLQTMLMQLLASKECIIGIVGDRAQSIYGFQGASPQYFDSFKIGDIIPNEYSISNNRRSTSNIVHFCNYLRKSDGLNQKAVLNKYNDKVTLLFGEDNDANSERLNQIIKNSNSIVLTRSWVDAIKYAEGVDGEQKEFLKKLYNSYYNYPGDFRLEVAEHNKIDWIRSLKFLMLAEKACLTSSISILKDILNLYINTNKAFMDIESVKMLFDFFKDSKNFYASINDNQSIIEVIDTFNTAFASFSSKDYLIKYLKRDEDFSNLLEYPLPDSEKEYDKKTYELLDKIYFGTGKKLVEDIFSKNSKYITTYQAKGAEFDSVFVSLRPTRFDKDKQGGQISILNVFLDPNTQEEEFHRILYVASSRAKNKLFIHVDCSRQEGQAICASIDNWKNEMQITEDFYDFNFL